MTISSEREFFRTTKKHPDRFYLVHYSCQNLNDDNEGLSPRVTSIAVLHLGTGQVVSFSTHTVAEELGYARDEVLEHFDEIELLLLQKFFDFAKGRKAQSWVHWNMRNITYGFEHIEHRYRTLAKTEPPSIPVEHRINLSDMLASRYGADYAADPKMPHLMDLNGKRHRHFLTGEEEVAAFKACEFIRMHQSTLSKVEFFRTVIHSAADGKLSTASRGILNSADRLMESRGARLTALVSSVVGIPGGLVGLLTLWP
jgi:hypothetical protein